MDSIKDQALHFYKEHGWFPIPIAPKHKAPYIHFTFKQYGDNLPTEEDFRSWSQWDMPDVRLGTRTGAVSGIIVVDCDGPEAEAFMSTKGVLTTPRVRSGREEGGSHYYFKHPGFPVRNMKNLCGVKGLEVKGDGGIVVLPPSIHEKSGRPYKWIHHPDDMLLSEPPAWLLTALEEGRKGKTLDLQKIGTQGISEGGRDETLFSLACRMRHEDWPIEAALAMIRATAISICKPPFPIEKAQEKVIRAYQEYEPETKANLILPNVPKKEIKPVSFGGRTDPPPPMEWVLKDMIPKGHTSVFYGAGGQGKSILMVSLGLHIAAGSKDWLGKAIMEPSPVLYVDFELTEREMYSRVYKLSKGMGLLSPPEHYFYLSTKQTKLVNTTERFETALYLADQVGAKVVIFDSMTIALRGNVDSAQEVIRVYTDHLDNFCNAGMTPILVDHQSKLIPGQSYAAKTTQGSGFKQNLTRSEFQIQIDPQMDQSTKEVVFRHKKSNFGPLLNTFVAELRFDPRDEEIGLERKTLTASRLASEARLKTWQQVLIAFYNANRHLLIKDVCDLCDLKSQKTVQNALAELRVKGFIEGTGKFATDVSGRPPEYHRLTDAGVKEADEIIAKFMTVDDGPEEDGGITWL